MSKQNSINSQDVLKAFKSNNKERFWKEKIIAIAILLSLCLILYFIFSNNKTKDFVSKFQGNIASKTNFILFLTAKDGNLDGYYYDLCDSLKKITIKGTLNENGSFILNELEENNPNSPLLKGSLGNDGSLSGERVENFSSTKLSFYFTRITSLPQITCEGKIKPETTKKIEPDTTNILVPLKTIKLKVKGKNLSDLRITLDKQSKKMMKNINYKPQNSYLDILNFIFTCDLIPDSSANFSKIGLFFGPKSVGYCESCSNVLTKNPGATEFLTDEDNDLYYSIIALPR